MPKEAAERYMEWLEREEERLGIGTVGRASATVEDAKSLLYDELGYEPTEGQVVTFMDIAKARYEVMPEVEVTSYRVERPWGYQMVYQDVATGRFISYAETSRRIGEYWKEWGY